MRRITLKDGPLDGKSYDVPDDAVRIRAMDGAYRLTPKTGQWEPTKAATAKTTKPRAPRARASKAKQAAPIDAPVDDDTSRLGDGGSLPAGNITVENTTGEPEQILTPAEYEALNSEEASD